MSDEKFGVQFRGQEVAAVGRVVAITTTRIDLDLIDTSVPNWRLSGEQKSCAKESVRLFKSLEDVADILQSLRRDASPAHARIVGSLNTR